MTSAAGSVKQLFSFVTNILFKARAHSHFKFRRIIISSSSASSFTRLDTFYGLFFDVGLGIFLSGLKLCGERRT